ncbi:exosortase [Opitutaceae bacterium TAV5]|nr:exosortase [Opitutaceae bacterium TAV5]
MSSSATPSPSSTSGPGSLPASPAGRDRGAAGATGLTADAGGAASSSSSVRAATSVAVAGQPRLAWVLVVCTAIVFWPVTRWVATEAAARQQIMQGIILLGAAAALVGWLHRRELRVRGQVGNSALLLLALAFGCVAVARWWGRPLLVLPGMALGLAGSLRMLFGDMPYRLFLRPLVVGVSALLVIVLLFPVLDWPLRQLAGVNAARILDAIGVTSGLSVFGQPDAPQLMLRAGSQSFVVATECNGFGLITSSALLALLAGGISRQPAVKLLVFAVAGVASGFFFNLLRILVICLLAPKFPGHYHAMHEIVGTIMLWAGLGLVGWMSWRKQPAKTAGTKATEAG